MNIIIENMSKERAKAFEQKTPKLLYQCKPKDRDTRDVRQKLEGF
jgi:hypothetical protein